MHYSEISLNARKQILQSIGWIMFIFCIGRTFILKDTYQTKVLDFIWIVLAVYYIFRGLKLTNRVIRIKSINLNHPPTRVMFVIYSLFIAFLISFGVIYNLFHREMVITSPYDHY